MRLTTALALLALLSVPGARAIDITDTRLVSELTDFVSSPTCAEMQGDGAPCASAAASCDQCRKLETLLEGLRTRLHEG